MMQDGEVGKGIEFWHERLEAALKEARANGVYSVYQLYEPSFDGESDTIIWGHETPNRLVAVGMAEELREVIRGSLTRAMGDDNEYTG